MNLHQLILTENACYKAGKKITPKGIMVHSTGANNPNLKRYVGPDDGLLGVNKYGNHWNTYYPAGREVCVHAFIGLLADGTVATYQTLPWDHRGWHAGGSANNTHIGFEICEDGLGDPVYFRAVYQEAVELCAHLCQRYNLTAADILCHSEGHKKGIASNHGDVLHWFPKHGKSMDDFRAAVQKLLTPASQPAAPAPQPVPTGEIWRVQVGAFSRKANAEKKMQAVKAAGFDAFLVCVDNKLWRVQVGAFSVRADAEKMLALLLEAGFSGYVTRLGGTVEAAPTKSIDELAREVIRGEHGSGEVRKQRLGTMYDAVQKRVNELLK